MDIFELRTGRNRLAGPAGILHHDSTGRRLVLSGFFQQHAHFFLTIIPIRTSRPGRGDLWNGLALRISLIALLRKCLPGEAKRTLIAAGPGASAADAAFDEPSNALDSRRTTQLGTRCASSRNPGWEFCS